MRIAKDSATGLPVDQTEFARICTESSAPVVARCDLMQNGQVKDSFDITGGTISYTRTGRQYARLTGLTVDAVLADLPTVAGGRFTPAGWEARIWAGLRIPLAVDAIVALGTFPLETSAVEGFGIVAIDAWDRSAGLAADLLTSTLEWPGGYANLNEAIADLVNRTFPGVGSQFAGAVQSCPVASHERDASPLDIIVNAATASGQFVRFDGLGEFTAMPEPDLALSTPTATFSDKVNLGGIRAEVTNRDVYNAWTVIGANPAAADVEISATAYDDDVNSPTRWNGPMGRRPKRAVRMELVDTQAKAEAAAVAMRSAEIGFGVDITATVAPHYLIEPGDVITVNRPAAGLDNTVAAVYAQTIDLAPGPMTLRARARQGAVT